jgi:hypothetical protein
MLPSEMGESLQINPADWIADTSALKLDEI